MPTAPPPASDPGHLPALDGLRGVAILLVLLFHYGGFVVPPDTVAVRFASLGWAGVDLFFVLSGFLITGILYDSKGTPGYFRVFYARRTLRIMPLYFGTLVLIFGVVPLTGLADAAYRQLQGQQLWFWGFASNWWVVLHDDWLPCRMNHFWSLAVEEQFYLLWPLVVFFAPRKRLPHVCLGIMLAGLALRFGLVEYGPKVRYMLTFARVDSFAVGGLAAWLVRNRSAALAPAARAVAWVSGAVLAAGVYARPDFLTWNDPLTQTLGFTAVAVFFGACIAATAAAPARRSVGQWLLRLPPLRTLGKYSFAVYVFHFPLLYFVPIYLGRFGVAGFPKWGQACLYFGLTFGLAWLSWHLMEKHFLKLKRFFPTARRVPHRAEPGPEFRRAA